MVNVRAIPSIEQLRRRPSIRILEGRFGHRAVVEALRLVAADVRQEIRTRDTTSTGEPIVTRIEELTIEYLSKLFRPSLIPVINATGVVLHTNLGRAPLATSAVDQVVTVAGGYSNLEYDIERGVRGRRDVHAEGLLKTLTGADGAVIVNNNAAAVLLVLASLAAGREVIVSRGELVEVGGGFRIPDVMTQSGARLREVGTTNRTRASDYAAAVSDRTALIFRVHPSNFRIEGFTERPRLAELVELGRRLNVPVVEDLGGGLLAASPDHLLQRDEPTVRATVDAGIDLCCFSGDKLLGGPQSGIVVGRETLVAQLRRHPLMRALRVDKMTYAALEATLGEYASNRAAVAVPVQRMLSASSNELRKRALGLASRINAQAEAWKAEVLEGSSAVGGGAAPGLNLPTWLVAVEARMLSAAQLEQHLRLASTPVVARIESDRVVLDLRTVLPEQDEDLGSILEAVSLRGPTSQRN